VPEYFRAGANAVGIGGEIFKREWMESGNLSAIKEAAAAFVEAVKKSARF
jgi:2-keto-3-deoxy-6-phosphogluconate aldolase